MSGATVLGVAPTVAQWYYCATVEDALGETTYVDGYATGEQPTPDTLQGYAACAHQWVAGIMSVHPEDVDAVATMREVECDRCGRPYAERDRSALTIIGWEVTPTGR